MEQNQVAPVVEVPEKKKSGITIFCIVLLFILALGGVAFGVYGMIVANQPKDEPVDDSTISVTCPDGTVEKIEKIVDNNLAQNLINPYIHSLNFLNNIFDYYENYGFVDDLKVQVAFRELDSGTYTNSYDAESFTFKVPYVSLNKIYKDLFGGELHKKSYDQLGKLVRFIIDGDVFTVSAGGAGGAGLGMFDVVKSAYYSNDKLVVEVYHDVLLLCDSLELEGTENDGYCLTGSSNSVIVDSAEEENFADLLLKFEDRIPVYKMIFATDNGHYVLENIEKQ